MNILAQRAMKYYNCKSLRCAMIRVAILLCSWSVFVSTVRGEATSSSEATSTQLQSRLRDEAPRSWEALEDVYGKIRAQYRIEVLEENPQKSRTIKYRYEIAINGSNVKRSQTNPDGMEDVRFRNDVYACGIGKAPNRPDAKYVIGWLEKIGSSPDADKRVDGEAVNIMSAASWAWKLAGRSFVDIQAISGFRMKSVSDEGGLVKVEFDCFPTDPEVKRSFWLKDAFIKFDPANSWVIREYGATLENGAALHGEIEYSSEPLNGVPRIEKRKASVIAKDHRGVWSSIDTTNYESLQNEDVPDSEFRLSFYGLPEPNFNQPARWSFWIYVNLGVISLIVAYILWRRRRQAA